MATTNISITINTPQDMTIAEALRLFTDGFHYQTNVRDGQGQIIPNPETRQAYAKRMIAEQVKKVILQQERAEKARALTISNITVE